MHLLCLPGRCRQSGANRPDRLVGYYQRLEVGATQLPQCPTELSCNHADGRVRLPLQLSLSNAEDRDDPMCERRLNLGSDQIIRLTEELTALGVAEDCMRDTRVEQHRGGDLSGECPRVTVVHVLCGEEDIAAQQHLRSGG